MTVVLFGHHSAHRDHVASLAVGDRTRHRHDAQPVPDEDRVNVRTGQTTLDARRHGDDRIGEAEQALGQPEIQLRDAAPFVKDVIDRSAANDDARPAPEQQAQHRQEHGGVQAE